MKSNKKTEWLELNATQLKAVDLLMLGYSHRQVAEEIGTTRETVSRWTRYHPGFQAEMNRRRKELAESSLDRLRDLLPKALDVIEHELDDENSPNRHKIALQILKAAGPLAWPAHGFDSGPEEAEEIIEIRAKEENDVLKELNRPKEYELESTTMSLRNKLKEDEIQ